LTVALNAVRKRREPAGIARGVQRSREHCQRLHTQRRPR
jgi:hypothetical protein